MGRQRLEDGRWFETSKAKRYLETCSFDGRNMISDATGSQWEHEVLYRTAGGQWILRHWSQWEGRRETWTEVDVEDAARWLVACGHDVPEVAPEIAALEVK